MEARIGRGETTFIIIITADVKTKKILGIESRIEGTGPSEPATAPRHVREAVMRVVNVGRFYGDGTFDVNDFFSMLHITATKPIIKIRKTASTDRCRGSKHRRRGIREYQEKGYKT